MDYAATLARQGQPPPAKLLCVVTSVTTSRSASGGFPSRRPRIFHDFAQRRPRRRIGSPNVTVLSGGANGARSPPAPQTSRVPHLAAKSRQGHLEHQRATSVARPTLLRYTLENTQVDRFAEAFGTGRARDPPQPGRGAAGRPSRPARRPSRAGCARHGRRTLPHGAAAGSRRDLVWRGGAIGTFGANSGVLNLAGADTVGPGALLFAGRAVPTSECKIRLWSGNMTNKAELPPWIEFGSDQRRQLVDALQVYEAWRHMTGGKVPGAVPAGGRAAGLARLPTRPCQRV